MSTQFAVMPQAALLVSDNTDMLTLSASELEEQLIEAYQRLETTAALHRDPFQAMRDELADEDYVVADAELNRFLAEVEQNERCAACLQHRDVSPKSLHLDVCNECGMA